MAQAHEYCLPSLISLLVPVDVKHHERRRRAVSPFRCRYRGTGARVSPLLSVCTAAQAHECLLFKCLYCGTGARVSPFRCLYCGTGTRVSPFKCLDCGTGARASPFTCLHRSINARRRSKPDRETECNRAAYVVSCGQLAQSAAKPASSSSCCCCCCPRDVAWPRSPRPPLPHLSLSSLSLFSLLSGPVYFQLAEYRFLCSLMNTNSVSFHDSGRARRALSLSLLPTPSPPPSTPTPILE